MTSPVSQGADAELLGERPVADRDAVAHAELGRDALLELAHQRTVLVTQAACEHAVRRREALAIAEIGATDVQWLLNAGRGAAAGASGRGSRGHPARHGPSVV